MTQENHNLPYELLSPEEEAQLEAEHYAQLAQAEQEQFENDLDEVNFNELSEQPCLINKDFYQDAVKSLTTVQDMIRWVYSYFRSHDIFFGHGYEDAWQEARTLVLNRLYLPYETSEDYLLNSKVTDFEKRDILDLVQIRVHKRMPLAYLINSARFLNRDYYVDTRVIIPRSPIGELIQDGFLNICPKLPETMLDMCTGSGVLAIALAERFPNSQVDAIDISEDALDVANINLEMSTDLALQERLQFIQSDLFSALPEGTTYDLIISNPPYVDAHDLASMPKEFRHEPAISLGSGVDGLNLTSKLLHQAADYLNPEGVLVVEVGNSRYHLEELLPTVPFRWIELKNGGHGVFVLTREQLVACAPELEEFYRNHKED